MLPLSLPSSDFFKKKEIRVLKKLPDLPMWKDRIRVFCYSVFCIWKITVLNCLYSAYFSQSAEKGLLSLQTRFAPNPGNLNRDFKKAITTESTLDTKAVFWGHVVNRARLSKRQLDKKNSLIGWNWNVLKNWKLPGR